MRIATFMLAGQRQVGRVSDDGLQLTPFGTSAEQAHADALPLIELMFEGQSLPDLTPASVAVASVRLEAPLPLPRRNLWCVGRNYHAHDSVWRNLTVQRWGNLKCPSGASAISPSADAFAVKPDGIAVNTSRVWGVKVKLELKTKPDSLAKLPGLVESSTCHAAEDERGVAASGHPARHLLACQSMSLLLRNARSGPLPSLIAPGSRHAGCALRPRRRALAPAVRAARDPPPRYAWGRRLSRPAAPAR